MKVATRLTVATAIVVALTAGAFALFDLRAQHDEHRHSLEREARNVAAMVRVALESQGPAVLRAPPPALLDDLSRSSGGWTVEVIPRSAAVGADDVAHDERQLKRLRTLLELPRLAFITVEDDELVHATALSVSVPATATSPADHGVVGMLEVRRPTDDLDDASDHDRNRALLLVGLIVGTTTLAVAFLAQRVVKRPISQLLGGIDDVAKGDLSHVILSERDDEIGMIATRFNEMTSSLRESRAETDRQNQAKLGLEQRIGQTEKLATIGQLAAEIAHEVGTPLGVIGGRARATQRKAHEPETVAKNAAIIAEQTARITTIIQRLLDFARRKVGQAHRGPVQLDELSVTTMELLSGQFSKARIKTRLERAEGLPAVDGEVDRLQQVLINLLINAAQATPAAGQVVVETSVVRRTRPGLEEGAASDFVRVAVSDSGPGIPEELRDQIFDPFFTTKDAQGGTGLGLAICQGIVKEHDGWIEVAPRAEATGATFAVYLPVGRPRIAA